MPKCKQCGDYFPKRLKIDGKFRNLSNRTKCLACLPFGQSTYRHKSQDERRSYLAAKARRYYNKKKEQLGRCPILVLRDKRKKILVKAFGGGCQVCGYNRCMRNLAFHHVDGKDFRLSSREMQFSLSRLLPELKKCIMACHNCHGEIHDEIVDITEIRRVNLDSLSGLEWRDVGGSLA